MTNFGIQAARTGHVVDTRWRTQSHGENVAVPGQVAVADFTDVIGLVNPGYIPSGTALAKEGDKIVLFDGDNDLYGFVNDNDGADASAGDYTTVAVLLHGVINPNYLPVVAQRAAVKAVTGSNFIITEV